MHAPIQSAWLRFGEEVRVQQAGQLLQSVDQAGARTVDDVRVDGVDAAVLDGGDVLPAGPRLDGFRGCYLAAFLT